MKSITTLLIFSLISVNSYAQIVDIPDSNFKAALIGQGVDTNNDGEIQESEASVIQVLVLSGRNISDLTGISAFTNLVDLRCSNNSIEEVDLSQNINLQELSISNNLLSVIDLSQNTQLTYLAIATNNLTSIDVIQHFGLLELHVSDNLLTNLDLSQNLLLTDLTAGDNNIPTIDLSNNTNLESLYLNDTGLTNLDLSHNQDLEYLNIQSNQLVSLDITQNTNLLSLNCIQNQLASLDVSQNINLNSLSCIQNQLTSLDVTQNINLANLHCDQNFITDLDVTQNINLISLTCSSNLLTSIDVSQNPLLEHLGISYQGINELDVGDNLLLESLWCLDTSLSIIDLSNNTRLGVVSARDNDFLHTLITKNGNNESLSLVNTPNLTYVCADDNEISNILNQVSTNAIVNSYCSFSPGGNYNTIEGYVLFDSDNNGCNSEDIAMSDVRVEIDNGIEKGVTFTNSLGKYSFYTNSGDFTVTIKPEISSCYENNYQSFNAAFPDNDNDLFLGDFCVIPIDNCDDVEIIIFPIGSARPGFDSVYGIIYKNKGSDIASGDIELIYDDTILDYVSSSIPNDNQEFGSLTWSYTDLVPFETRTITVTLNLNSPMETPAVNIGDELDFQAVIEPIQVIILQRIIYRH